MGFWDRVRSEVKAQRTTQEWVAVKAGIRLNTFQGWISKGRLPDVAEAVAIAQALGVTVEYLVTGADSTDPWLREHRAIIDNLKSLKPADVGVLGIQIEAVAQAARIRDHAEKQA